MPPWLQITLAMLNALLAGFAAGLWLRGSASTPARKSKPSPEPTLSSDASTLASMAADQAALFSTLEKLTTTVKRLSSRHGMRELRDQAPAAPPIGTPKTELRKFYGVNGMSARDQAQHQLQLERSN